MSERATLATAVLALSMTAPAWAAPERLTATIRNDRLVIVAPATPIAGRQICPNAIEQAFPLSGPEQTRWQICWRIVPETPIRSAQLAIGPVSFRKSPGAQFVKVMHDMRVAEIHVPYYNGQPRFLDITGFSFGMEALNATDCPGSAGGTLVSDGFSGAGNVCIERRDRGVMWKDGADENPRARRGEEVVLWGALNAANYSYIQSFAFRDDGVIVGRAAATGQNLPYAQSAPHTHNIVWRLDADLNGDKNTATLRRHIESTDPDSKGSIESMVISNAGAFIWKPQEFTTISIGHASLKNAAGRPSTYHLMPMIESGMSRHSERFTKADFWVTPYSAAYHDVPQLPIYVQGGPPVAERDLMVWVKGSALHHPRSEDGQIVGGKWIGTTHTMWTGFMMMPHDLFNCAPFYEPCQ